MTRLEEIAARLKAATPGPWSVVGVNADDSELATPGGELVEHIDLFHEYVPLTPVEGSHRPAEGINVFRADMSERQQQNVACLVHVNVPDAHFIAHAPEDIAYLLDRVRGLRGELGSVQAESRARDATQPSILTGGLGSEASAAQDDAVREQDATHSSGLTVERLAALLTEACSQIGDWHTRAAWLLGRLQGDQT